jgi:starch synthase
MPDRPNPLKAIPLLAGADFYLCPSTDEPGGLLPMQASRYGTIPIVSQVGALVDNFSEDDAIIIKDGGLTYAIEQAFSLYADEDALQAKRKACMEQDFSWDSRKAEYVALYEGSKNE